MDQNVRSLKPYCPSVGNYSSSTKWFNTGQNFSQKNYLFQFEMDKTESNTDTYAKNDCIGNYSYITHSYKFRPHKGEEEMHGKQLQRISAVTKKRAVSCK